MQRDVPEDLRTSWEQAVEDPDAVAALVASRTLFKRLSSWQSALVEEAMGRGATWEDVGDALGTTRQAAWARFRHATEHEGGSRQMAEQIATLNRRIADETKSLHSRLREFDDKWREERNRLQLDLRRIGRERAEERKSLLDEIKQTARSLREEIRRLREPPQTAS